MFKQRPKYNVVAKFRVFRSFYDRIFIIFAGILWIFSTLWDIYKLQRYWLDYTVEFYGCFFIFNMMIFSTNPKLIPIKIYNSFSLITTIKGRGTLLILMSSLFLTDIHAFHKFCAIILLIGGIFYFICEILVPTTREELEQIESYYKTNINSDINNNSNNNINKSINNNINKINININNNPNNNIEKKKNNNDINTNTSSILEKSNAIFNAINLNTNLNAEIGEINNDIIEEEKEQNEESKNNEEIKNNEELKNNEEIKNNEENQNKNDNKDILVEEEIVRKTDNPYEIPEDF